MSKKLFNKTTVLFICCCIFVLFPTVVTGMGTGSISVIYPLPSSYMSEDNITRGFCDPNPSLSSPNIHNGIDISVPSGTSVHSICDGKVHYDEISEDYWNSFLIIEHNCDGQIIYGYYGHIEKRVEHPNAIKAGDVIGTVGHHNCYGDHLLFSISTWWDKHGWGYDYSCEDAEEGGYKDPLTYLRFNSSTSASVPTSFGHASVSEGVAVSPDPVVLGQNFTVSFTLKELRGKSRTFEEIAIAILDLDDNLISDFANYPNETISANGTLSRSGKNYLYDTHLPGTYKAIIRGRIGGEWFDFDTTDNGVNPKAFEAIKQDSPPVISTSNIDTALIIDSSGSMLNNDPYNNRLEAARFFVDGAGKNDYVTVIDFDDYAYVNPNGTLRKAEGNRDNLKKAVNAIDSSGGTNISNGLLTAYNQLSSSPTTNQKIAILLTDGVGGYNYEAFDYEEKGWKIFTIGLSDSVDEALLKDIAQVTEGRYFKVTTEAAARYAISEIYQTITQIVHESGESIIQEDMNILQGEVIERGVEVPRRTASLWIDRLISGSDVETSLVQPDGTVIDRNTQRSDVYHALGATYEIYRIDNPMLGEWTMRLEGTDTDPGGEPTSISASAIMPDHYFHTGDYSPTDYKINLSELLRLVQLYNVGSYHCDPNRKDGYAVAYGDETCTPHDSDYAPQDWRISLSELLRFVQLYGSSGYNEEPNGEDGFSPGR